MAEGRTMAALRCWLGLEELRAVRGEGGPVDGDGAVWCDRLVEVFFDPEVGNLPLPDQELVQNFLERGCTIVERDVVLRDVDLEVEAVGSARHSANTDGMGADF